MRSFSDFRTLMRQTIDLPAQQRHGAPLDEAETAPISDEAVRELYLKAARRR